GAYSAGALPKISGTSNDATAGVDHIEITIRDTADGKFYDGSSWQFDVEENEGLYWITIDTSAEGGETVTWTYNNPGWVDGKYYRIKAKGYDKINNESPISTHTFIYDTTKPSSTITQIKEIDTWSPLTKIYFTTCTAIQGNAKDIFSTANSSVAANEIYLVIIRDQDEDEIVESNGDDWIWDWNISTWTIFTGVSTDNIPFPSDAWGKGTCGKRINTTWEKDTSQLKWKSGKLYFAKTKVVDCAGNVQE
ncbi:unnamed protein product, partial [marine sediment metagenome]